MLHVTKLFPNPDLTMFHAFGRVLSGTCESASVCVLLPPLGTRGGIYEEMKPWFPFVCVCYSICWSERELCVSPTFPF